MEEIASPAPSPPKQKIGLHEVLIRPPAAEDLPFIFSSWLKSYRDSDCAKHIPNEPYFRFHHKIVESILSRASESGTATIKIACLADSSENILGWLVSEGPVLHYVYIKNAFRRLGIASKLLGDYRPQIYSHRTYAWKLLPQLKGAVYVPYAI